MALRDVSLDDLYLAWTLVFMLSFSPVALLMADNNARSIIEHLAAAGGVAVVIAAWFSVPMWAVIQLAS